jgi:pimeloyl-ACP methyl ester carboxylesterase
VTDVAHTLLGHGPAFVWGHGLTSSRATEDQLPLLRWDTLTEAGRQVVRYDAAGHGETGGAADPGAYEWPRLATDLLALLDQLGLDRVDAGGASMGCASTLHAAVRAPERFRRLVLVIPPTAWDTRAAQAEQYEASAAYVEREGKAAWLEVAADTQRPAIFADLPPAPMAVDIPDDILPSVLRGAAASDLPSPEAIAGLKHEALILAWAGDPGHPESTAHRLAELLPHSQVQIATELKDLFTWSATIAEFLGAD